MAGINKAIIIGNLGNDPELRETQGGSAVCNLRIATTRSYTKGGQGGERVEETEWHSVVVFGRQAESAAQYLTKGRQVYVEGRLQTREYDDKDGVKRRSTEIVAETVQFLGGGRGDDAQGERGAPQERRSSGGQGRGGGGRGGGQGRSSGSSDHDNYQLGGYDDDVPF